MMRGASKVIIRRMLLGRGGRGCAGVLDVAGIAALALILSASALAQAPAFDEIAPPPTKLLSKSERNQLKSTAEPKDRIELALALMDGRVKKAEELKAGENFDEMYIELGGFHALVDDTLTFLNREVRQRGKVLKFFKKYEIGLRTFAPRLELIRRDLPSRYDPYVLQLLRHLRDARSRAIEPFYGDTVLPDKP